MSPPPDGPGPDASSPPPAASADVAPTPLPTAAPSAPSAPSAPGMQSVMNMPGMQSMQSMMNMPGVQSMMSKVSAPKAPRPNNDNQKEEELDPVQQTQAQEMPERFWINVVTWFVFGCLLMAALHLTMIKTVESVYDAAQNQLATGEPVKRTYLIAICLNAFVSMWFRMLFLVTISYVWCVGFLIMFGFMPPLIRDVMKLFLQLFNPSVVFHFLHIKHVAVHGCIMLASLVTPIIPLLFYVRKEDLMDPQLALTKTFRIIFVMPCIIIISYFVYAIICMYRSFFS